LRLTGAWTLLILIVFVGRASGDTNRDALVRVDLTDSPKYRSIWSKKLEITPFDCGRLVVLPAFQPERAISIYSYQNRSGQHAYRVTYVRASENIWQASDGVHDTIKAEAIKTRRIDADIPAPTAKLLRILWVKMLRGVRYNVPPANRWKVVPIDPAHFEWSVERSGAPPLLGQLNVYTEIAREAKDFAELSDVMLPAYCEAKASERAAIAREIEQKAKEILQSK
jgi:hypothetical protein